MLLCVKGFFFLFDVSFFYWLFEKKSVGDGVIKVN